MTNQHTRDVNSQSESSTRTLPSHLQTTQSKTPAHLGTSSVGNTHSWIKYLRAAPSPTQSVNVRFNMVCMDIETTEQRVFENIRCRLKEDLDSVEVQSRVAAKVCGGAVARAERLIEELSTVSGSCGFGNEEDDEVVNSSSKVRSIGAKATK